MIIPISTNTPTIQKRESEIIRTTITEFAEVLEKETKVTATTAVVVDGENTKIHGSGTVGRTKVKSTGEKETIPASEMTGTEYDEYFEKASQKYGVSVSLLKAMTKMESDFNPNDVSSSGAMGLMQLMPETAAYLGVTNPFDPEQNIMGGARYISEKIKEYNGDISLALAAYNAGSGTVKQYGNTVPPQCKTYVAKILSYKEAYEVAQAVG